MISRISSHSDVDDSEQSAMMSTSNVLIVVSFLKLSIIHSQKNNERRILHTVNAIAAQFH